ncbi:MarR family winged helix-turn-helix transcriptional regulator [Undibacterium sp. Ji22W]|uniref:MarR family winged helix-turn-helix transcriptional regulator n=1 Tax=Undibacterium sp. Ji22W TaxID=3413038 RepID=UPI003BF3045E
MNSNSPSISPAMQLLLNLASVQARMLRKIDAQLSAHGISFTEFMVMHHLYQAPNYTLRRVDLADSVSLTASGVTRLLLPMEKIHLIEKEQNPRDARVSLVRLSDAGIALLQDALVSFENSASNLTSGLDNSQIEQLDQLMAHIR